MKNHASNAVAPGLDSWLKLMIGIGVIIVSTCTFFMHAFRQFILLPRGVTLTHGEVWELGAVAWSFFFVIYYVVKLPWTGHSTRDKYLAFLVCLGMPVATWFAIRSIVDHKYLIHFGWVVCIGLLFTVADTILWNSHGASQHGKMFRESWCVADLPLMVGCIVLFTFLYVDSDVEAPDVFLAGAISFQLLVSNVLFVMSQAGVIRRIWEKPKGPGAGSGKKKATAA